MKKHSDILAENRAWAEEMLALVDKKMSKVAVRSRDKLPDGVDEHGVHLSNHETKPNGWTTGFFGGLCAMLTAALFITVRIVISLFLSGTDISEKSDNTSKQHRSCCSFCSFCSLRCLSLQTRKA